MRGNLKQIFVVIALFALAVTPAFAASKGGANRIADSSVARADFSRDLIIWEPAIEYSRAYLRVSGASGVIERSFEVGEAIHFDLIDRVGNRLLDGAYSYELTFSPFVEESRGEASRSGIEARDSRGQRAIQSGYFTIADGLAVMPDVNEEGISFRDQVILDDLIVDGSLCVGQDCVNGESFGFDTIRLKENNLRIKFQDTSNSASFPRNDWQITANDSTNGGAEKFSIDDIDGGRTPFTIEASAPSHSLYVDDGGRLGFGTSVPVVELHVVDGDTPTLRLQQDGSSGFTPQTWDVAGNETNFFIRDVTNGSTLPFRIRPGAPTSAIDVNGDGDVGLNTTSPDSKLHVVDSANQIQIEDSDDGQEWRISANGVAFLVEDETAGTLPFRVDGGGLATSLLRLNGGGAPCNNTGNDCVSVGGDLRVTGQVTVDTTVVHPDYVFEEDYDLLSIEDHANKMWEGKHLPAVGKGEYNKNGKSVLNVAAKTMGIIEELEVAHIYIEQLNEQLSEKNQKLEQVEKRLARLEKMLSETKAPRN